MGRSTLVHSPAKENITSRLSPVDLPKRCAGQRITYMGMFGAMTGTSSL